MSTSLVNWGIPPEKIVQASTLFEKEVTRDFELEDLLSVPFYHQAVCDAYPEQLVEPPADPGGKRTKYYERQYKEIHNIGFNKRRVAEKVKKLLLEGKGDQDSLERLRKLTEGIWQALQAQVGARRITRD